ncbi:transglutaminase domain-containing protein [Nocardioides sp. InS609-2]|uniref:transglutaminase-like domain-containing protein n=1 Tax=Nocardioides sp. InS609-2 TaxID=2760705 RepID=UPI0020C04E8E|nr:transglutaminase domain-containing protein [Nocardioides sp. InS609-2]
MTARVEVAGVRPPTLHLYAQPSGATDVGRHRPLVEALPRDVDRLTRINHALVVHEHIAPAYGVVLTDEDYGTAHHRSVERVLDFVAARDGRPFDQPRAATSRVAGNCWHFVMLLVATLRVQGTPARARCGFAGYFSEGRFEDHWVCEYWHPDERRWVLVDAQVDAMQRSMFEIDFDHLDVPRDRFLVAGEAWARCRAGTADPGAFGLSITGRFGEWYVAANLMRDAAALQRLEMLPDDTWGAMPGPGDTVGGELAALLDGLGTLTLAPDTRLTELEQLWADERLRVPKTQPGGS